MKLKDENNPHPQLSQVGNDSSEAQNIGAGDHEFNNMSEQGAQRADPVISDHAVNSSDFDSSAGGAETWGQDLEAGAAQEGEPSPFSLLFSNVFSEPVIDEFQYPGEYSGLSDDPMPAFESYELADSDFFTFYDDNGFIQATSAPDGDIPESGGIAHSMISGGGLTDSPFHSPGSDIFSLRGDLEPYYLSPGGHVAETDGFWSHSGLERHEGGEDPASALFFYDLPDENGMGASNALHLHMSGNVAEQLHNMDLGRAVNFEEIWINLDQGESGTLHIDSETIASLVEQFGTDQVFIVGNSNAEVDSISLDTNVWSHDHTQDLDHAAGRSFSCFTDGNSLIYVDADLMINPK